MRVVDGAPVEPNHRVRLGVGAKRSGVAQGRRDVVAPRLIHEEGLMMRGTTGPSQAQPEAPPPERLRIGLTEHPLQISHFGDPLGARVAPQRQPIPP